MTRSTIGGCLDTAASSRLAGEPDQAGMRHFRALDRDAQAAAIRRMAALGRSEYEIAGATALAVEQIRRVLAEHPRREPST